ncbi:outer membrane beta-barrel protein [Psychroserpens mesophilus]|uniref:outer membrane beta-barrel protein n=1 Tax=Psychroserpens mesophilus TaxID=325473 RepID=UPI003D646293
MKKLLLLSAVAVFGLTNVNAQDEATEKTFGFEKGNIMVEGNLGFSSSTDTDSDDSGDLFEEKNSSLNFNPKAGYFISDKFAVGIQLNLNSFKNEDTNLIVDPSVTEETKTSSFGGGVFARYYFLDLGERFKTYGEFGVGFNSGNTETTVTGLDDPIADYDTSGFGAGVSLGINYFVTECFAINFVLTDVLSYNSTSGENNLEGATDEYKVSSFNGNVNVFNNFFQTAQFGLTWKF